jgi:hypothetical protein
VLKREVECARPLRLQTRRTASKLPHDQKCDRCGSRCSCAPVLDCCTVLRFMCPSDTYINDAGPYEQTIKPRFCTPGVFGRPKQCAVARATRTRQRKYTLFIYRTAPRAPRAPIKFLIGVQVQVGGAPSECLDVTPCVMNRASHSLHTPVTASALT